MLRLGHLAHRPQPTETSNLRQEMEAFLAQVQQQVPAPLRIVLQSASKALSDEQLSGVLDEVDAFVKRMRAAQERDHEKAQQKEAGKDAVGQNQEVQKLEGQDQQFRPARAQT